MRTSCPLCEQVVRLPETVTTGQRVRCSSCHHWVIPRSAPSANRTRRLGATGRQPATPSRPRATTHQGDPFASGWALAIVLPILGLFLLFAGSKKDTAQPAAPPAGTSSSTVSATPALAALEGRVHFKPDGPGSIAVFLVPASPEADRLGERFNRIMPPIRASRAAHAANVRSARETLRRAVNARDEPTRQALLDKVSDLVHSTDQETPELQSAAEQLDALQPEWEALAGRLNGPRAVVDATGAFAFRSVQAGKYYLWLGGRFDGAGACWMVPVQVSGTVRLDLTQDNGLANTKDVMDAMAALRRDLAQEASRMRQESAPRTATCPDCMGDGKTLVWNQIFPDTIFNRDVAERAMLRLNNDEIHARTAFTDVSGAQSTFYVQPDSHKWTVIRMGNAYAVARGVQSVGCRRCGGRGSVVERP